MNKVLNSANIGLAESLEITELERRLEMLIIDLPALNEASGDLCDKNCDNYCGGDALPCDQLVCDGVCGADGCDVVCGSDGICDDKY